MAGTSDFEFNTQGRENGETHLSPTSAESFQNSLFEFWANNPYPLLVLTGKSLLPGNPASTRTLEEMGYLDYLSMLGSSREAFFQEVKLFRLDGDVGRGIAKYVKNESDENRFNGEFWRFGIESVDPNNENVLVRMERINKRLLDPVSNAYTIEAYEMYKEEMNRMLIEHPEIPIQIVAADTDSLKEINDKISHTAGDEAIRATVALLMNGRRGDLVFRNGHESDEMFAVKVNSGTAQEDMIRRRLEKLSNELVEIRNRGYPDKIGVLPQNIASVAIVSSDSILFDPERKSGESLNMTILLAVAAQMRYAVKRAEKIAQKIDSDLNPLVIIEQATADIEELMLRTGFKSGRNDFYKNVISQITEANCDRFGLAVNDLPLLKLALIGHEIGDHPATQGDKETVVRPEHERNRIPLYSNQFFLTLYDKTGVAEFLNVANIVSRHHLRFNEGGYPIDASLDMDSKEDRMANMINIIDAFYSMCNRQEKQSERRGSKKEAAEAIDILLQQETEDQFNSSLVENLKDILVQAQKKLINKP